MATIINASNSTGLTLTSDLSGTLQFQNNGVNLPMGGVAPAFEAINSSYVATSSGSWTKVTCDVEHFDTNSNFASSRFTPTVAGYYQFSAALDCYSSTNKITNCTLSFYKNGVDTIRGSGVSLPSGTFTDVRPVGNALFYLNGSTDYVELYVYCATTDSSAVQTYVYTFSGVLVRGA